MTKYLAGVLTVIAVGVLGVAYGLLVPRMAALDAAGMTSAVRPMMVADQGAMPQPANGSYAAAPVYAYVQVPVAAAPPATYAVQPRPQVVTYVPAAQSAPPMAVEAPAARPVRTVSYEQDPPRRVANDRYVERKPRRDWKKTAMIIGGSSAAGAGVGAIFGGKKGALIGAAIGGGASTIYETRK
ncbi:MAG: hypothetical protein ABL982_09675 [Vicinamibacterales bacterium]